MYWGGGRKLYFVGMFGEKKIIFLSNLFTIVQSAIYTFRILQKKWEDEWSPLPNSPSFLPLHTFLPHLPSPPPVHFLFTDYALWAGSVIDWQCPSVSCSHLPMHFFRPKCGPELTLNPPSLSLPNIFMVPNMSPPCSPMNQFRKILYTEDTESLGQYR